jgi:hypothetical protein
VVLDKMLVVSLHKTGGAQGKQSFWPETHPSKPVIFTDGTYEAQKK